ncbi:uncharacterized protein PHACADRAFT_115737 [Phanerochaete carnosa HHB-10118-sp]|uniref:cystathionine gamma-synthase n=1 Tax=Phanerochaete carnosa (strain HHB-10118-sp) TaxID=650164 RepID=K5WE12_PHACS|nr:uncharacterized protein PHACADRAFT_115737 [Phanerochaete carnosa HHB-10118-sp]EKM57530.1 hypothetical protein PHACADRAFT_115737 [Phanerochaete carnosa HHB-10118-sp]
MSCVAIQEQIALGAAVPALEAHAISVSLPTWEDNIGYEEGDKRVIDTMVSGYPRFFIHLTIRKLAGICEQKFGVNGEQAMLFPTLRIAEACRDFMVHRSSQQGPAVPVRLVQFLISPENASASTATSMELHIVLFPADAFPLAKQFWQHAGLGISSRLAAHCLSMLPDELKPSSPKIPPPPMFTKRNASNRHYAKQASFSYSPQSTSPPPESITETFDADHATYLEERYGRNLPVEAASFAKRAMRRRIAGVLVHDTPNHWLQAGEQSAELGPSTRGVMEVSEEDVFLYPTGMSAIFSAHQLALGAMPLAKSICFGFPYTDTLKVLQKWGPGCHFFGHGLDKDIDELESQLAREHAENPGVPPALALFTEFPSNPLLRSADLPRLRALADKYNFLIVVDETLGNFANVEVLPHADVVVSSLSKVFSGDANVMGGSLVLNPKSRHYDVLKAHLSQTYEDSYFGQDAIYMERNSRDFRRRARTIDDNTEAVCDFLCAHPETVKEVFYPKYTTSRHYEKCRVSGAGYGGLFSVTFRHPQASRAFFDAMPFFKGPSLGTNFTLACPYTILGHYLELDWAAGYGVEEGLVRVSVGMEHRELLLQGFQKALRAAEKAASSIDRD